MGRERARARARVRGGSAASAGARDPRATAGYPSTFAPTRPA
jgi:hypothetical protein